MYIINIENYINLNNTTNGIQCILIVFFITVTLITQLMVDTIY